MATKRVAIIGAGVSGLPAIKSSLEEGFHPVCFEMRKDVGGLWNFTEVPEHGKGSVMESTVINLSKDIMSYSDFPMPASAPNYLKHDAYQKYLARYADAKNLRQYIQFETQVLEVKKAEGYINNGKWTVSSKDKNGKVSTEQYDFVMVCAGIHGRPNIPKFPGIEKFSGEIVHAHEIRRADGFRGKRVVVVGLANTGGDVAVELSRVTSQVYLSTRSGNWIYSRVTPDGYPVDFSILSRKNAARFRFLPMNWTLSTIENLSLRHFPNQQYGIKPAGRAHQMEPMFNDHLPAAVVSGQIIIQDNIQEFTRDCVKFENGATAENIDVVVMATGYDIKYPFLESVLQVEENEVNLFNYCLLPDLEQQTLAIIGCIQPNGPYPMISELQTRYAARIFKKLIKVPSREEMLENLRQRREADRMRYRHARKNTVRLDPLPYCDILAKEIGCKPNLGKMLLTDPKLALECFFGPLLSFQYRLTGPGKWSGARDVLLTWRERNLPVNKNGQLWNPPPPPQSSSLSPLACLSAICILLVAFIMVMN